MTHSHSHARYQSSAYLVGYYGMLNSGDDALMTAAHAGLKRLLPNVQINLSTSTDVQLYSGEYYPASLRPVQRFMAENRLRQYAHASQAMHVVFGGGSVFHNARDINLKRHLMKLSAGRQHYALGVGLGPFKDLAAERACARFLNECSFTGLRDAHSLEVAMAIAPDAHYQLTFDLAPQLLALDDFSLKPAKRSGIAVCLCPHERLSGNIQAEQARLRALAKTLEQVQRDTGEMIYLVDFNGHAELGDRQVHRNLAHYFEADTRWCICGYDSNPLTMLQLMAGFKLALCMRLHASVFAYLTKTPQVSLNYHRKCTQWARQIGLSAEQIIELGELTDRANSSGPHALSHTLRKGLNQGFFEPLLPVNQAIDLSMSNWSMLYETQQQASHFNCYSAL